MSARAVLSRTRGFRRCERLERFGDQSGRSWRARCEQAVLPPQQSRSLLGGVVVGACLFPEARRRREAHVVLVIVGAALIVRPAGKQHA